ncbi:MAG: GvpL/GvpF family gas vesicle protein [Acidobacteria bacterium]|nr:GvpL/GvpF family gas vesicle protein [Acidobacteriota bacterium]
MSEAGAGGRSPRKPDAKRKRDSAQPHERPQPPTVVAAIYVYCFARPFSDLRDPSITCYRLNNVVAVTSTVPAEDYCGPAAEERMRDVSWIGPRACKHEQVIERVMQQSPVLPVHLGTLFSSEGAVREFLRSRYFQISDFLDRVSGKEEWSIRVLLEPATAKRRLAHDSDARGVNCTAVTPGTRYLQLREREVSAEGEMANWLARITEEIHSQISAFTEDSSDRPVLDVGDVLSGRRIVFNWSFLVSKHVLREFHERIHEINTKVHPHGLGLEAVGPWPPYSFISKWNIDAIDNGSSPITKSGGNSI